LQRHGLVHRLHRAMSLPDLRWLRVPLACIPTECRPATPLAGALAPTALLRRVCVAHPPGAYPSGLSPASTVRLRPRCVRNRTCDRLGFRLAGLDQAISSVTTASGRTPSAV
jgi:hypothetical protein